jgi:hypothetical protein
LPEKTFKITAGGGWALEIKIAGDAVNEPVWREQK